MADTSYEYDVLDDTLDEKVDGEALQYQIEQSAISSATVLYVNTGWRGSPARDKCDVWFDDPLSPGDETILTGVLGAHDGDPLPQDYDFDEPVRVPALRLQEDDTEVARDGAGNMTFVDANSSTKTLAELATAGQPDLSKVVLEVSGSLVYTGDGNITTVE